MTIRTPDFARLVDSFARGKERAEAMLDEPLGDHDGAADDCPEDPRTEALSAGRAQGTIVFGIGPAGTGKTYWPWRRRLGAPEQRGRARHLTARRRGRQQALVVTGIGLLHGESPPRKILLPSHSQALS